MTEIEVLVAVFREGVDRDLRGPFTAHLRKNHDVPAGRVVDLTVFTERGPVDFEKVPVHDSGQEIIDVHPEVVVMREYDRSVVEKVEAFAKKQAAIGSSTIEQAEGAEQAEGGEPEVDEERPTPEPPVEGGEVQPSEGGTNPIVE